MPKFIDLTNQRFGSWVALKRVPNVGPTLWMCQCDCGTKRTVQAGHLRSGASTNCGCLCVGHLVHGGAVGGAKKFSLAYRSWRSMRARVLDKNHKDYAGYGGGGIRICERWNDFENFVKDMGERPSLKHSIDRWPDPKGNYEPGNCRWATREQQVEMLPQNQKGYRHKSRNGVPR